MRIYLHRLQSFRYKPVLSSQKETYLLELHSAFWSPQESNAENSGSEIDILIG